MNLESMPQLILASLLSAGLAWFFGLHGVEILIEITKVIFQIK